MYRSFSSLLDIVSLLPSSATCHYTFDMLQRRCPSGHCKLGAQQPRLHFRQSDCHISQPQSAVLGRCRAAASDDASISSNGAPSPSGRTDEPPAGVLGWLKKSFGSSKLDKQKLAEYGLGEAPHVLCETSDISISSTVVIS